MAKEKTDVKRLVLGIGNFSKTLLAECEPMFFTWTFAVLDFWSVVQEISFVEGEEQIEECTLRFKRDLSFFVTEPKLAVRFDADKYDRSDTAKILRWTFDYRKALRRSLRTDLKLITRQLSSFKSIVVVLNAIDEVVLETLPLLVPKLQKMGIQIQVLSSYIACLQSGILTAYARQVTQFIANANLPHRQVRQQDIFDLSADLPEKDLFQDIRNHMCKELATTLSLNPQR